MRIRGILKMRGTKLHVDLEAPDGTKDLFVTVRPDCLVVPRSKWSVDSLGLPTETIAELRALDISMLSQLIDENWNLGVDGLTEETRVHVTTAVERVRGMVLDHGEQLTPERPVRVPPMPTPALHEQVEERVLDTDIDSLRLSKEQRESLRNRRNVNTWRDLVALGKTRLLMTPKMDEKGLRRIEEALTKAGIHLPD